MSEHDQPAWDARYSEKSAIWSRDPNPQLVAEAAGLKPGRALDLGAGEGADAIWLAGLGWTVTGVEFSTVALGRAASHAEAAGVLVTWEQHDVREWAPPAGSFDLVSSQYMHLPAADRGGYFARIAAAVAPGGLLLVVGHDVSDIAAGAHRPPDPGRFFGPDEVVAVLGDGWEILDASARSRPPKVHEGQVHQVADATVVARRR